MSKVKIVLTSLTFALALTGVVVAKANEKKRFATDTVFFRNVANNTWHSIQADGSYFDQVGGGTAASIASNNNGAVPLYFTQNTSDPAKFTQP